MKQKIEQNIKPVIHKKYVTKARMWCVAQNFNTEKKTDIIDWFSTEEEANKKIKTLEEIECE